MVINEEIMMKKIEALKQAEKSKDKLTPVRKKLGVKAAVSVERKLSTGCPSNSTDSCGINYRNS